MPDVIEVGMPVEERHAPDYPWPEPRMRGTVTGVESKYVVVRWSSGLTQLVERNRIGDRLTDLARMVDRA